MRADNGFEIECLFNVCTMTAFCLPRNKDVRFITKVSITVTLHGVVILS